MGLVSFGCGLWFIWVWFVVAGLYKVTGTIDRRPGWREVILFLPLLYLINGNTPNKHNSVWTLVLYTACYQLDPPHPEATTELDGRYKVKSLPVGKGRAALDYSPGNVRSAGQLGLAQLHDETKDFIQSWISRCQQNKLRKWGMKHNDSAGYLRWVQSPLWNILPPQFDARRPPAHSRSLRLPRTANDLVVAFIYSQSKMSDIDNPETEPTGIQAEKRPKVLF